MQPLCVDLFVVDARNHLHVFHGQGCAVDPSGRFSQAFADLGGLALQHGDFAGRGVGLRPFGRKARAVIGRVRDAPFLHPFGQVGRGAVSIVDQMFRHIEPDAACTDYGNALTRRNGAVQDIDIADDIACVLTGDLRITWDNTGGDDHLVIFAQIVGRDFGVQLDRDAMLFDHRTIPVDEAPEFLFAGDLLGKVQLAANL